MTQEQILSFNKKCAEFLGWKKCLTHEFDRYGYCQTVEGYITPFNNTVANLQILEYNNSIHEHSISDLQFHSDWNWIHEVMQVISLTISFKTVDECTEEEWYATIGVTRLHMIAHKEAAVQAIRRFLDWYYENK